MILDLFEFSRQSGEAAGETPLSVLTRLDLSDREGMLCWKATGGRNADGVDMLMLDIDGEVGVICQRCLEPMRVPVAIRAQFHVARSEAEADAAPLDDDLFDSIVGSARFDLVELIEDEVLLSLPVVPKHERCPGEGAIVTQARPSPFASLVSLKTGDSIDSKGDGEVS